MFWEEREHLVEDQVQKCNMDDVIFFRGRSIKEEIQFTKLYTNDPSITSS
jgi:hypothetical protein